MQIFEQDSNLTEDIKKSIIQINQHFLFNFLTNFIDFYGEFNEEFSMNLQLDFLRNFTMKLS